MQKVNMIYPVTSDELIEMFEELNQSNLGYKSSIIIDKSIVGRVTVQFAFWSIEIHTHNEQYLFDYSTGMIYHKNVMIGKISTNVNTSIKTSTSVILKRLYARNSENSIAELLIDDEDDLVKLFLLYNNNLKYEAIGELIDNIDLSKETFKPAYDVLFDIVCGIMFIHSQAGKILNKLQEHNAETKELLFGKICPTTRAQMLREISEEANKQFQKIKSY